MHRISLHVYTIYHFNFFELIPASQLEEATVYVCLLMNATFMELKLQRRMVLGSLSLALMLIKSFLTNMIVFLLGTMASVHEIVQNQ